DGVTELCDEAGEEYGTERLVDLLAGRLEEEPRKLVDLVHDDMVAFSRSHRFDDDSTIVVVRRRLEEDRPIMHRLVAYAHNGVERFSLDRDEMVVGSDAACDIHLPFSGVGHRHARVLTAGETISIEDLGSRRGILLNGERVKSAR